jgi:hypothetical protein
MDFLDPRRRKAHRRRLFIGYVLMSIVVAIGTMIILYLAYGYDIDRKTGDLIQNGIVFVDSKPGGASIFVNDVRQGSLTDTRMVLPAGVYTVRLEAEGYRHWERTFNLEGGQIQRLVYPYLIPNTFNTADIFQYDSVPQLATQSPDRRWVLIQKPGQVYQLDLFDLNNAAQAPKTVTIPSSILTSPNVPANLTAIEWSTDNRHVMFSRDFGGTIEYLMIDHESPNESININKVLGIAPALITLRDKKFDQFYYLDSAPGTLRSANTSNRTLSAPLANAVINFKSYSDDIILYTTQENVDAGKTDFRVIERDKTYALKTVTQSEAYVMDVARYDDEWYYVVGGSADNMAFVYKNPLPALKQETRAPLIVTAILRLENPRFVSFSANTQFIALQSGNQLITLDLEDEHQYRIKLEYDIALAGKLKWMDGHRLTFTINSQSYIVDFDGSNVETLVSMNMPIEPLFDRNFDNVFTVEGSKQVSGKQALTRTVLEQ